MKSAVTYLLVCVLVTFCTKKIESIFDISELENILDSTAVTSSFLELEDLLKYINDKRDKKCNQKQQKDISQDVGSRCGQHSGRFRFKRNECDDVKFTLPAIPRLRNIDAESVAAPVVLTASSYIWRPLGRCGKCASVEDESEIEQNTKIDMKGLNECETDVKAGCKNGKSSTPKGGKKQSRRKKPRRRKKPSKKKKPVKKRIGLRNGRLFGTLKNGTRSKEKLSIEHPQIGLKTKVGEFLKGDLGSLEKKLPVISRMFSKPLQNKNGEAEILRNKKTMFGMKVSNRISNKNRNITSKKKSKEMQKLPKKLKSALKSLKVDLNYYDGDNGLIVLNNLMKQFLTRFKSKSPHLAGKLKEAFKKFIVFNLIQTFLDSYKSSKRKMLTKPKSKLENI